MRYTEVKAIILAMQLNKPVAPGQTKGVGDSQIKLAIIAYPQIEFDEILFSFAERAKLSARCSVNMLSVPISSDRSAGVMRFFIKSAKVR